MKNHTQGVLVVIALASAVALSAQAVAGAQAPSTQTPPASPTAPAAPTAPTAPASATAPTAANLPTAEEIVNKHVEAMGGKDAISKVKSVYTESSITVMGAENPATETILDGVGYKSEMEFNGTKIVQCYTDKGGWTINPMAGAATATPMPEDVYNAGKGQIYVGGPLYDYAAKGSKIELLGKDGAAYKVKVTSKENVESVYMIDSTSYLITSALTKAKMQDQDVAVTTKLSDYRKSELGLQIPYAIDVDLGGQFSLTIAEKKVELNKPVDPAVFAMPK